MFTKWTSVQTVAALTLPIMLTSVTPNLAVARPPSRQISTVVRPASTSPAAGNLTPGSSRAGERVWSGGVTVKGATTAWRLTLLSIRRLYRIPHVEWRQGYRANMWQFFVLTLRLTNTGPRPASPYYDLMLALKVIPPYRTRYAEGWAALPRKAPFVAMYQVMARTDGGDLPWQQALPDRTATYSYVIGTNRGESHYGLYNTPPGKRYVFLLKTGL